MNIHNINFGKYKNLAWKKLSTEYLHGLADMGCLDAKDELHRRENLPIEKQTIGFGKYRGKLWVELDNDYLHWITSTMDPTNDKVILAFEALEYKKQNNLDDIDNIQVIYIDE